MQPPGSLGYRRGRRLLWRKTDIAAWIEQTQGLPPPSRDLYQELHAIRNEIHNLRKLVIGELPWFKRELEALVNRGVTIHQYIIPEKAEVDE